jgi:hypothetical protein
MIDFDLDPLVRMGFQSFVAAPRRADDGVLVTSRQHHWRLCGKVYSVHLFMTKL